MNEYLDEIRKRDVSVEDSIIFNKIDNLLNDGVIDREIADHLITIAERKILIWNRYADICLNENPDNISECNNIIAELKSIEELFNKFGLLDKPFGIDALEGQMSSRK